MLSVQLMLGRRIPTGLVGEITQSNIIRAALLHVSFVMFSVLLHAQKKLCLLSIHLGPKRKIASHYFPFTYIPHGMRNAYFIFVFRIRWSLSRDHPLSQWENTWSSSDSHEQIEWPNFCLFRGIITFMICFSLKHKSEDFCHVFLVSGANERIDRDSFKLFNSMI